MMKEKKIPQMSHVILLNLKRVPSPGSGKMMPECASPQTHATASTRCWLECGRHLADWQSLPLGRWEDMAAVSCAVQNMQLMATSLGVACALFCAAPLRRDGAEVGQELSHMHPAPCRSL